MSTNLYLVTVPVAFLVRSEEEHKMTSAYYAIDTMVESADEIVYHGEIAVHRVF